MKLFFQKFNNKLDAQGGFLKSVSVLVGGTAFAQALAVLVLPLITRIYSPEEFALFAVYTSIVSILTVAVCLRFEIAIPLPEKDEDALSLFMLSLISNIMLTTILVIVIFFFQESIFKLIQQPQLKPYKWLIPIGVFLAGLYNAFQYWATRQKQFGTIAQTRMTQAVFSSTVQIGAGYLGFSTIGLLFGQIINFSAGIIKLFAYFLKETKHSFTQLSMQRLKENWKNYDKFPKYSTFEALANIISIQLPIIIIAAVAIGPEAGYLMLAMKVMAIPMGLVGGAIGQVYLAHAPEYYKKNDLKKYTVQTIYQIAKITVIPLIIIGTIAPYIFPIVFGENWAKAGYMLLWMVPWFIMQILSSPVSMALHITANQKIALILQFVGFILRVGGLWLVSIYFSIWVFEYYAISGFIFYLIYLLVIIYVLKDTVNELKRV